jgi:hypothetical protein
MMNSQNKQHFKLHELEFTVQILLTQFFSYNNKNLTFHCLHFQPGPSCFTNHLHLLNFLNMSLCGGPRGKICVTSL